MANRQTIAFTMLELKGLWVRATGGDTSTDLEMDRAADNAVDKVYRAEKRMPKKATPPKSPKRGSPIKVGKAAGL